MPTPHKHAEVIRAWADGHKIETEIDGEWKDCPYPSFHEAYEYRIKPFEKKTYQMIYRVEGNENFKITLGHYQNTTEFNEHMASGSYKKFVFVEPFIPSLQIQTE